MLILSRTLLAKIQQHAEAEYPHECCGALIGNLDEDEKSETEEFDETSLLPCFASTSTQP